MLDVVSLPPVQPRSQACQELHHEPLKYNKEALASFDHWVEEPTTWSSATNQCIVCFDGSSIVVA